MIESLDVMLWGRKVGTLVSSKVSYRKRILFYFDSGFVKNGYDVAPLRAPLSGVVAQSGLPVYPEEGRVFGGLPSFISDSLPDDWGNRIFREWARTNNIRRKDLSPLDVLAYIGRRGMGALEFVPPVAEKLENPFKIEIDKLAELARQTMNEANAFHFTLTPGLEIESLFKVGTSAGGRRPKAVVNIDPESGDCWSGQVASPVAGAVPCIIKFDEHCDVPATRIEYSFYLMALDAGLRMMPSRLLESSGSVHFITERFDRADNRKLHVQTLAAMNPFASSYEEWFEVAERLGMTPEERQLMFLQLVMNVLAGNVDDHSKNFSFIMDRDGNWSLAPTYDFTFAVDTSAPLYVNRHSLTVNGTNDDITLTDLLAVASRFDIKSPSAIIRKARATVEEYHRYGRQAGVPDEWITRIGREIGRRRETFESGE